VKLAMNDADSIRAIARSDCALLGRLPVTEFKTKCAPFLERRVDLLITRSVCHM
jgi:hypothetical protein